MSCDPSHITPDCRSRVMWLESQRGVRPHAPVNHMVFFLCHGFMYINKILKTTLIFDIMCELLICIDSHMKTFTCLVVLDFTQWVWI